MCSALQAIGRKVLTEILRLQVKLDEIIADPEAALRDSLAQGHHAQMSRKDIEYNRHVMQRIEAVAAAATAGHGGAQQ